MSVPEVCLKLGCARRYAGDAQIISPQRCHRAALLAGVASENGIYGHSRFCNTDFDDKLACLNLSGV
ncbi:hypothetical protein [Klebsiella quasipneumoniae]|uniref:Uncharacterized protein n=1 Tax=Klebsiella pneumoniae TaxID=573 RepID=A0A483F2G3_KLEPN